MTNQEAIEIIDTAISEVEWEYPVDYATAFDMAKEALKKQLPSEESFNLYNNIVCALTHDIHVCGTCGKCGDSAMKARLDMALRLSKILNTEPPFKTEESDNV